MILSSKIALQRLRGISTVGEGFYKGLAEVHGSALDEGDVKEEVPGAQARLAGEGGRDSQEED